MKGPGHREECSISFPNSNDVCMAHATNSPRYFGQPRTSVQKLIGTLPSTVNTVGLQMAEPDLGSILLQSLPDTVRGFVVYHSDGESYTSYRNAV